MIDYEKLSHKYLCNIFFFINKFLQVATLTGSRGCFPLGFLPRKNIRVLIFDLFV
jgi:hypothetical protein